MRSDKLSDLSDWEDEDDNDREREGEGWKSRQTRDACKKLYQQWQHIMLLLNGAMETLNTEPPPGEEELHFPPDYWDHYTQTILGDGYEAAVKIRSSEAGGLYIIRMGNAAIIRKNAQYIYSALLTLMHENVLDEEYAMAIRTEIDKFRDQFKYWVSTFQKDEYEDEWGLFV